MYSFSPAERWLSGGSTVRTLSYSYDAASQVTSASDPSAAYSFSYDGLGRATSTTHDLSGLGPNVVLNDKYDAVGNRLELAATIGTAADFLSRYQYDKLHRMTRIEQLGQSGGNAVAEKRIDLAYDQLNRFDTITRYADLVAADLVVTSDYTFDNAGRLTDLTHSKGASVLADYGWSYGKLHRVTQLVSSQDGTVNYSYDVTSQVTGADYVGDWQSDEGYSYDLNGNRTNTGYSTGSNNRLLSDGTFNYEYDGEGNRTKKTNIATGAYEEYSWDHRNRLTRIVSKDGSGSVTKTVDYRYDIFDRRIEKAIAPSVGPAETEQFVYDGQHIALRFENGNLANRYLHGPVIDQILADEQVETLTQAGDVLWPLADNLGTVRDLVEYEAATDTTSVANHIVYDSFGRIVSQSNAAVDHIFGYTGRESDEESDLYYYRARYYDPAVGRFVSEDPIGFEAGDANVSRYVINSPTNYMDPSGMAGVGHHWVPIAILLDFKDRMTTAAYELGMGATSGPTEPTHCYGTYGGVSHARYNDIVRDELTEYMRKNKIKVLSQDQMFDFMKKKRAGRDHAGDVHEELKSFNDSIRAHRDAFLAARKGRGFRITESIDSQRQRGRNYINGPRFASMAIGAMVAEGAEPALAEAVGALDCASRSGNYRRALEALSEGDLSRSEIHLFGSPHGSGGFYMDLVGEGHEKAALNFEVWYKKKVKEARAKVGW